MANNFFPTRQSLNVIYFTGLILSGMVLVQGCSTASRQASVPQVVEDKITRLTADVQVTEVAPSDETKNARKTLDGILKKYDLEPFLFSHNIRIESGVIPAHLPSITLNSDDAEDANYFLSTLLHQEFHWYVIANTKNTDAAVADLKKLYPEVPKGLRNGGTKSAESTYQHLIICWLEFQADKYYLGQTAGEKLMKEMTFFNWIYETVVRDEHKIAEIVQKHSLLPSTEPKKSALGEAGKTTKTKTT